MDLHQSRISKAHFLACELNMRQFNHYSPSRQEFEDPEIRGGDGGEQ